MNERTLTESGSCAFRLAQLDFDPDQQQSRHQRRPKNNNPATANSFGIPEENQTNICT